MTTTNVTSGGNFIVHTKNIRGQWSQCAYVAQKGIDPSLFWDDDGTCYFVSTGSIGNEGPGIFLCQIDPFTGKMLSPSQRISLGCGGRCPEGPHIYKRNGWYYLMLAEGGTEYGHMETIQRARSIYGPYEKCPHNPILSHRDHMLPIQAVGHADIVDDPKGNWWLVCLGIRPIPRSKLHLLGRETFLAPLVWGEDGWPTVNENGTLRQDMAGPLPGPAPTPVSLDFIDDFQGASLDLRWNFVRNPMPACYRLEKGAIRMFNQADGLSTLCGHPTMIALRQQAFCMATTARLHGDLAEGQCSGLSAFYNSNYHYDILITKEKGSCYVCLRKCVGDIQVIAAKEEIQYTGSIRLKIVSSEELYTFYYENGGQFLELGTGMTAMLCTETMRPKGYTGVFWGCFTEKGEISLSHFEAIELS